MNISYKDGTLSDVRAKEIDDFVAATMELMIQKGTFTNLLSDRNDYPAIRELMDKHKKLYQGEDWTFNVAIANNNDGNGTAKFTKLFDSDSSSRVDVMKKGKVSPCFVTANYVYDVREKVLNSGSQVQRIDFIKEQMTLMYQSYYELIESAFWGSPKDANDDVTPFGIKFWLLPATNTSVGSFEAVNPSAGWFRAGIDSTTNTRWANWSARYDKVTSDDLIKKMRYAARKTNFKSPLKVGEPTLGKGRAVYANTDTVIAMEEILESQNMNLGNDLASKDGKTLFKSNPVYSTTSLDDDATAPVYMLDWATLGLGILAGWDKHVSAPEKVAGQHNVRAVFLDGSMNFVCTNLRNQAVISKASA
jgi:hypothetical protein